MLFAVILVAENVPEVAREAVPQAPLPLHVVALVELQVRVLDPPLATEVGLADMVTVGAGVVQLSPGCLVPEITLSGVQVLSDRRSNTLSTFTPALKPRILAV